MLSLIIFQWKHDPERFIPHLFLCCPSFALLVCSFLPLCFFCLGVQAIFILTPVFLCSSCFLLFSQTLIMDEPCFTLPPWPLLWTRAFWIYPKINTTVSKMCLGPTIRFLKLFHSWCNVIESKQGAGFELNTITAQNSLTWLVTFGGFGLIYFKRDNTLHWGCVQ